MCDAALAGVALRPAQSLVSDFLAGHRPDNVRARDVELALSFDHHHVVGQGGGVAGAPSRRAEDSRYLGYDAGGPDIPEEDVAVAREGVDTLLDAGASRVDEADHRGACGDRLVHHLADLLGCHLGQRAAHDGEVLGVYEGEPAVDLAVAGHDGVAEVLLLGEPKLAGLVHDEAVDLLEGALVHQHGYALSRSELALAVLGVDPALPAAELRLLPLAPQLVQSLLDPASHDHN